MNKDKKLRIYLNTNAPWAPSGYGMQAAEMAFAWQKAGYNVACGCFYGLEGMPITLNDVKMYPKMASPWGEDGMIHHARDFQTDITFTLQDIWPMDANSLRQANRWIPIVPIDHEPVPKPILDRLKMAYRIVTYSKFGQKELEGWGLASTYIPHTVDTTVFKPMDQAEVRKEIGLPLDMYLFGMVAANKDNPPRKSFQEVLDAFKRFHDKHPKSAIYFNTLVQQQGGFDITAYAQYLGIAEFVYSMDPYRQMYKMDKASMAKVYNCFDCLLSPSISEGFGVPIIEAQACGKPAIVNDCHSMPELVIPGETGEVCELAYKRWSPLNAYGGVPDVTSLHAKMEKVFLWDKQKVSESASKHIQENYDTAKVVREKWLPFLEKLESECYPSEQVDKINEH